MAVYVDNMKAEYRGMCMCHMIADTSDELFLMAERIGVQKKWIQNQGTYREHFDICKTKRKMAVDLGAIEISMREVGLILKKRKNKFLLSKKKRRP